jgi:polyisoprenoid-binding protein YceI
MKKIIITAGFLLTVLSGAFAQKYLTRTAKVNFNATAPSSPEKVEAVNNEVANIFDATTGDMIFQVLVKSFKFERALMQEHFNENYMESDKFPKADFKGKITNIAGVNYSKDGSYNVTAAGALTIHGVTHDVSVPGTITVQGGNLKLKAKFSVKLADYNISIPTLVADKINKEATVTLESDLAKK